MRDSDAKTLERRIARSEEWKAYPVLLEADPEAEYAVMIAATIAGADRVASKVRDRIRRGSLGRWGGGGRRASRIGRIEANEEEGSRGCNKYDIAGA